MQHPPPPVDRDGKAEDPDQKTVEEARMTFVEHLSELRLRLRNSAVVFLLATIVSFIFAKKYFDVITRPARAAWMVALAGQEPVFRFASPTEPFWVYTRLAIYGALLVASPLIFWELWRFVAPGLYRKEKRLALLVTIATAGCFVGGALFGYMVLCKPALTFMLGFAEMFPGDLQFKIEPAIMMGEVVGFMMAMLLGTGVAFELPVILSVMGWLGIVTAKGLWRFNKYALILSAVVGGILTPSPDVLSQLLMAGPLYVLFNISVLLVWLIERAARKRLDELARETGADLSPPPA